MCKVDPFLTDQKLFRYIYCDIIAYPYVENPHRIRLSVPRIDGDQFLASANQKSLILSFTTG